MASVQRSSASLGLTRRNSHTALTVSSSRDSISGFKSFQADDQKLVQKQLQEIRALSKQHALQTENLANKIIKDTERFR